MRFLQQLSRGIYSVRPIVRAFSALSSVYKCFPRKLYPILADYSESKVLQKKKMSEFVYPNDTPVFQLECEAAFKELSEKEKKYAHYLSRAAWFGGLIVLVQTSLESPLIFSLFHKLFQSQSVSDLKQTALNDCNYNEEEFQAFIVYLAGVVKNMGNYKGRGDTKFIPNLDKEKFEKLVLASKFAQGNPQIAQQLLSKVMEPIYSLKDKDRQLGFPHMSTTTYLSKNFTKDDGEIVKGFLKENKIEAWNSRLFKSVDKTGATSYDIRLASVIETDSEVETELIKTSTMNGHKFVITRGDYSKLLKLVIENLSLAKEYVSNENEAQMLNKFIHSFETGSLNAHKDGSRFWIKDKGPVIESYCGFIETYRDPAGVRAEFESFVAIVNKQLSVKFTTLVNLAESLLTLLPWPSSYEKDKFLRPDFTSLDVLTFAGSELVSGINIPNYQEIRQSEGFKNVILGNVLQSKLGEPPNYLNKDDQELMKKYVIPAFTVNVGLHELLGHGSGKMFTKNKDGSYNFDIKKVLHLDTKKEISSWYEEGENYDSVFGDIGSSYEECRAEAVALHLCDVPDVLSIFGHEGAEGNDIIYSLWLLMLRSGIEGLQMYDPKNKTWLQAHSQARYVLLQVALEAGEGFVKVEKVVGADGNPDLLLTLDRSKILTIGKPCIGKFLQKLQLYKATADIASAKEMYGRYSEVASEVKYPFLDYREIVMARKKPRPFFVQVNTFVEDDKIALKNYEPSHEGVIQSFVDRFRGFKVDEILEELWEKDKSYFS